LQAVVQRTQDGAIVGRVLAAIAAPDQAIERTRHAPQRPEFVLDLQFFLDGQSAYIIAAGAIRRFERQQFPDVRQREPALLGVFDEADTTHGFIVVQPVA
jgi:hypothetical protein